MKAPERVALPGARDNAVVASLVSALQAMAVKERSIAARHEALTGSALTTQLRQHHASMAALHRQAEASQLTAVRLIESCHTLVGTTKGKLRQDPARGTARATTALLSAAWYPPLPGSADRQVTAAIAREASSR